MKILAILYFAFAMPGLALGADFFMAGVEEGAEVSLLELDASTGEGTRIYTKLCDYCEQLTLRISDDTQFFRRQTPISMGAATKLRGIGATVHFNPETRDVTRIVFWR